MDGVHQQVHQRTQQISATMNMLAFDFSRKRLEQTLTSLTPLLEKQIIMTVTQNYCQSVKSRRLKHNSCHASISYRSNSKQISMTVKKCVCGQKKL